MGAAYDPIAAGFASLIAKLDAVLDIWKRVVEDVEDLTYYGRIAEMASQGLTDLQAAVTSLQTLQTTVIAEIQALTTTAGDPDATVETLAQQINASVAAIQAAIPSPVTPQP